MCEPCDTTTCKQMSRVLCYCCKKNFCLDHLSTHNNLIKFQSYSLIEQINILNKQIEKLNMEKLICNARQKLDKSKNDYIKKINRFYDEKYEELEDYFNKNILSKQKQINYFYNNQNKFNIKHLQKLLIDTKEKFDLIEEKGIQIHIQSLILNNYLITIGEFIEKEFNLTNLSLPYQILDYKDKLGSSLSCNNHLLLIDQNSYLNFYNTNLKLIHQLLWIYGNINDICWSSTLNSFIIITETNKTFLINDQNFSINLIESMNKQLWISSTCSNSLLYLVSLTNTIVQFNLLPTITYDKSWNPPMTCKQNESIKNINCNNINIALIIITLSNKMVYLLIRSLKTFQQLFSIDLNIINPLYHLPIRSSSIINNQWIIIDANTSQLFHIGNNHQIIQIKTYHQIPQNIILFNSNILIIKTQHTINFHHLFY